MVGDRDAESGNAHCVCSKPWGPISISDDTIEIILTFAVCIIIICDLIDIILHQVFTESRTISSGVQFSGHCVSENTKPFLD